MQEDVVDHPVRHPLEPVGQSDRRVLDRARTPARPLVRHPSDAARLRSILQVARREALGPYPQLIVGRLAAELLGLQPREHDRDPVPLLGCGHPRGEQHDGAFTVAVGRDGAAPTRTAPHLDLGCGAVGLFGGSGRRHSATVDGVSHNFFSIHTLGRSPRRSRRSLRQTSSSVPRVVHRIPQQHASVSPPHPQARPQDRLPRR